MGYPNPLPLDDLGQVDMNAWAFFPLYPMIVGALTRVTGGSFYVVGGITAMVIGAVAIYLLFRFVDRAVGRWEAIVAVVGVCTFISAPILQATYTESLALLLVVVNLMLIRARKLLVDGGRAGLPRSHPQRRHRDGAGAAGSRLRALAQGA